MRGGWLRCHHLVAMPEAEENEGMVWVGILLEKKSKAPSPAAPLARAQQAMESWRPAKIRLAH